MQSDDHSLLPTLWPLPQFLRQAPCQAYLYPCRIRKDNDFYDCWIKSPKCFKSIILVFIKKGRICYLRIIDAGILQILSGLFTVSDHRSRCRIPAKNIDISLSCQHSQTNPHYPWCNPLLHVVTTQAPLFFLRQLAQLENYCYIYPLKKAFKSEVALGVCESGSFRFSSVRVLFLCVYTLSQAQAPFYRVCPFQIKTLSHQDTSLCISPQRDCPYCQK